MKIAICFHGNCGILYKNKVKYEILGDVDYRIGYEHWKKHVFDVNDVDVFMHSWSIDFEKELRILKTKKFDKSTIKMINPYTNEINRN